MYTKLQKEFDVYKLESTDRLDSAEMEIADLNIKLEKIEKEKNLNK